MVEKKGKTKYVYACQSCNNYLKKDVDEETPVCCGKEMEIMDEIQKDEE